MPLAGAVAHGTHPTARWRAASSAVCRSNAPVLTVELHSDGGVDARS
jgi:hypothetical protein